jgi:hypothetical protein
MAGLDLPSGPDLGRPIAIAAKRRVASLPTPESRGLRDRGAPCATATKPTPRTRRRNVDSD